MSFLRYSLVLLAILSIVTADLNPDNVVSAINCGGDSYTDSKGVEWRKDDYFNGGQTSDFGSQFDIKLTGDQDLYQTERWSSEDLEYSIPLEKSLSGKHVLVLKFSEVYFNSINDKVFDVLLGDTTVVRKLDVFAKVGKATAYDEFIEFEGKDDKIIVDGKEAPNAIRDKHIKIKFKKGERDNPKINAILIVKGTLSDTDYDTYKSQFEDLERQRQEKEYKQREIQKKNNLNIDFEEFEDDYVDSDIALKKGGVFETILSPKAIMMYITFALIFYIFNKVQSSSTDDLDDKDD